MAALNDITIRTTEYRPCIVKGKKALFHRWQTISQVVAPSYMVGGHPGGQLTETVGIVEYEDGTIGQPFPASIRFCDPPHKDFYFGEEKEGEE